MTIFQHRARRYFFWRKTPCGLEIHRLHSSLKKKIKPTIFRLLQSTVNNQQSRSPQQNHQPSTLNPPPSITTPQPFLCIPFVPFSFFTIISVSFRVPLGRTEAKMVAWTPTVVRYSKHGTDQATTLLTLHSSCIQNFGCCPNAGWVVSYSSYLLCFRFLVIL